MHICIVSTCKEKHKGKGYCGKHYQRYKKRGTIEGFAPREFHGLKHTPEYEAWCHMKRRCYNKNTPQYRDYGGRGITVCDKWLHSFTAFLSDVGKKPTPSHSINRIDNDGNYEPGNVNWATPSEQASNKRKPRHTFRVVRTSTGYRGVYPYKDYWVAKLWHNNRLLHLGSYQTPRDAAIAYDKSVAKLYPDTAILNFPNRPIAT